MALQWLEESGQWQENVDRTHLVLAISKQVLQKSFLINFVSSSGHLWRHRSGGGSLHRGQRQRQQVRLLLRGRQRRADRRQEPVGDAETHPADAGGGIRTRP